MFFNFIFLNPHFGFLTNSLYMQIIQLKKELADKDLLRFHAACVVLHSLVDRRRNTFT